MIAICNKLDGSEEDNEEAALLYLCKRASCLMKSHMPAPQDDSVQAHAVTANNVIKALHCHYFHRMLVPDFWQT